MQTDRQKNSVFLSMVLYVCFALFTLLIILNTHANAMTIEYLIKYIDELELEKDGTRKQLNRLKGELINITRDGATLRERKEYVDRVIELMKKLDTIDKRRQELLKEARIMPHAPPVLKLVAIEMPEYFSDYEKNGAGLVIRRQSEINIKNGHGETGFVDEIMSLRIVRAPLEIRPAEPFEIIAEAMIRKSYPDEHWCNWRKDEENGGSLSIAISSKEINVFLKGKNSVESYCNEGGARKHEWPLSMEKVWYTKDATIKGDSISLSVQFKPINKTISGSSQVYFYDATASGDGKLKLDINTQRPFYAFDLPTDNRGYLLPSTETGDSFGARGSNGITINIIMPLLGGLALRYEPVHESDPVLTSLSIPDHPSEFFEPLKEGDIRSIHTVPDVMKIKLDAAKKLLEDVGLIADPKIKEPAKSEDLSLTVISQDPAPGVTLKNGSHVKLVIYGPYNSEIAIPDVAGLTVQEAKLKLEAIGLKARLVSSDIAPSEALSFKVRGSEPKAGDMVAEGTEVTVIIYGKYSPTQEEQVAQTNCSHHPGSRAYWDNNAGKPLCGCFDGLQWNLANTQCVSKDVFDNEVCARDLPGSIANGRDANGSIICDCPQGFVWNVNQTQCIRGLTQEEQVAGTNCSQYPGSRAYWDNNAGKPLCGCFDGLQWNLSNTQCVSQGVFDNEVCARDLPGSIANGRDANGRIICDCSQGLVWNNNRTQCIRGLTQEEQVAGTSCSHYPGSRAYWDNNAGKPLCGCFDGLQWNLANTQCVSQDVFDNELCTRDYPGTYSQGRLADGKINCVCPQRLIWDNNSHQCIRQPAEVVNNSQMDCSWKITQIKMFMSNYRASPDNILQKQMAENIANEARNLGCNQSEINAALGSAVDIDNPDRHIGGEDECPCIDEQGRRFRVPWGQDCDMAESVGRDYNCN